MGFITSRLGLRKANVADAPLITDFDGNWDVLDKAVQYDKNLADVGSVATARLNLKVPVLTGSVAVATTNVSALNTYKPVIDGVTALPGMQVLLTAQTTAKQNGPWVVSAGPGIAWTRPLDFATGTKVSTRLVGIAAGSPGNQGSVWMLATTSQIMVDTDAQTWICRDVTIGTIAGTVAAGNDSRIVGALQAQEIVNPQTTVTGTYTLPDITTATVHDLTLTGSTTIAMPTAAVGKSIMVKIRQDSTGSRVPTFSGVKWPSATAPTWSTGANKVDKVVFDCTNLTEGWEGSLAGLDYR